jgi:type IV secretory pathway VirJ component
LKPIKRALQLVAIAALIGGCGDDDKADAPQSTALAKAQVVKDLRAYYAALGDQDVSRVCDHVSSEFKDEAAEQGTNCPKLLTKMLPQSDAAYRKKLQQVRVVKVKIEGDRAKVTVTGGPLGGYTDLVNFRREDGSWKWTQLRG